MARQLRSLGYQAVALKGGYQAWRERYPVEPKSLPVDLKKEREDEKWSDLRHVTPAMDHFLAAKHMMGRRPDPNFVAPEAAANPPADGKLEPVQAALSTEKEAPSAQTEATASNGKQHADGAANGGAIGNGGVNTYNSDAGMGIGMDTDANPIPDETTGDKNDL